MEKTEVFCPDGKGVERHQGGVRQSMDEGKQKNEVMLRGEGTLMNVVNWPGEGTLGWTAWGDTEQEKDHCGVKDMDRPDWVVQVMRLLQTWWVVGE